MCPKRRRRRRRRGHFRSKVRQDRLYIESRLARRVSDSSNEMKYSGGFARLNVNLSTELSTRLYTARAHVAYIYYTIPTPSLSHYIPSAICLRVYIRSSRRMICLFSYKRAQGSGSCCRRPDLGFIQL